MKTYIFYLLLLNLFIIIYYNKCRTKTFFQATPWNNLTANIAVVEFQPIRDPSLSTNERILQNTKKYVEIVTDTNSVVSTAVAFQPF